MYEKTARRRCCATKVRGKRRAPRTADCFGHDLLKVATRFAQGERRPDRRERAGADRPDRLLALPAEDPPVAAGRGDLQPGGQPDHQLPEAALRSGWAALPGGGLRLRHCAGLGRGAGEFQRPLAGGVASSGGHAVLEEARRRLQQALEPPAGEPGLGRLQRAEDRGAVHERDPLDRGHPAGRALRGSARSSTS